MTIRHRRKEPAAAAQTAVFLQMQQYMRYRRYLSSMHVDLNKLETWLEENVGSRVNIHAVVDAITEPISAKKAMEALDDEIKVYMIQNSVGGVVTRDGAEVFDYRFEHAGMRMRVANGKATGISEDKLIRALTDLELDPRAVKWVISQAKWEKPYDFIDLRKTGGKDAE